MKYNFTFKTDADLEQAEKSGYDDTFDIVRVSFKNPDGQRMDIPLKSEEAFYDFINSRVPKDNLEVEKIYQDKHGFEHGKYDYLNYLEENKKPMKNKMTLKEFQQYVINEATKLYKLEQLKEQKEKIEKQISILSECVPPTFDKDGNPDYIAGAPLMSPETLAKVRAEMLKKATGWATPEPVKIVSEIDKKAMQTAKKDIEASGGKFEPLGKNKFEKNVDKKELNKAMSPEDTHKLNEKKYSDAASDFIGKEISHLQKDKGYPHDRAVAAAINIAKDKGYKVPKKTNEGEESGEWKMYFFTAKHDKGTAKFKTASTSEESARKIIAKAEGAPESALTFVKSELLKTK